MSDTESWPEWREPTRAVDAPFYDDAASRLQNMRAGLAQLSGLAPFVGPGVVFAASRGDSRVRREAAKAFNGQLTAMLVIAMSLGPVVLIYFASNPHFDLAYFYGFPIAVAVVLFGWAIQATTGTVAAFKGHDWTTPLARILHTQVLPEGSPQAGQGKRP